MIQTVQYLLRSKVVQLYYSRCKLRDGEIKSFKFSLNLGKTKPLCTLSLVERCPKMRVCKHGCDAFLRIIYKSNRVLFCVYGASS